MTTLENIEKHATKYIGYIAAVAGGIAIMDKELVLRTLGPDASDWALLITGVLALTRGHLKTRKEKKLEADIAKINQEGGIS